VVTANVPLLGDAAPGDVNEAVLAATLQYGPTDPFANGKPDANVFIEEGELLTEAFNDGPAQWNPTGGVSGLGAITLIANTGVDLTPQLNAEVAGSIPSPVYGVTQSYLQDTRDWYAVHGGGKKAACNILMADGSVKVFADSNNDKFLNPGFDVPAGLTPEAYAVIGYSDSTVELPPTEIFSGMFLLNLQKHSKFE
jgi:prepilin-type processing-associated H-X9-DG protein